MAVDVNVSCEGYSGSAADFVTLVELKVDGVTMVSLSSPGQFSGAWELAGQHVVEVWDRTAGNDWDRDHGEVSHGGPGSNLHAVYRLDCPVPSTTSSTTTTVAPTTTVPETTTTPVATTDTTVMMTAPVPVSVVEATVPAPRQQDVTTTMAVPSLPEELTSVVCQEDDRCFDCTTMGNLVCGPTTTISLERDVPCVLDASCVDRHEVATTVLVPAGELPATGADLGLLPLGALLFGLGGVAVAYARVKRPRRV